MCRKLFVVMMIYKDRGAANASSCVDILISVPHHEALAQIDVPCVRSISKQARLRLATSTIVNIVVIANPCVIELDRLTDLGVDGFHHLAALNPARHVRLICDHDEDKPSSAK